MNQARGRMSCRRVCQRCLINRTRTQADMYTCGPNNYALVNRAGLRPCLKGHGSPTSAHNRVSHVEWYRTNVHRRLLCIRSSAVEKPYGSGQVTMMTSAL